MLEKQACHAPIAHITNKYTKSIHIYTKYIQIYTKYIQIYAQYKKNVSYLCPHRLGRQNTPNEVPRSLIPLMYLQHLGLPKAVNHPFAVPLLTKFGCLLGTVH